jgi:predicted alpha/beta-fold hydrolase
MIRGSIVKKTLFALVGIALYHHHRYWKKECCADPEIICHDENHLVWRLESIRKPFCPTWYMTNPHVQTVANALFRRPMLVDLNFNIRTTKHTFVDSGATVYLDWITSSNKDGKTPEKTLFLMPGVVSGTDGIGILNLVQLATERNYRCIVFNYMSKSGLDVVTKEEYPIIPGVTHGIHDLSNILRIVERELGKNHPLIGVGMSLGANILVEYIGEQSSLITKEEKETNPLFKCIQLDANPKYFKGEELPAGSNEIYVFDHKKRKHPFTAVISIGNPYDLDVSTSILEKSKLHHYLYDSFFCQRRADMVRLNISMTSKLDTQEFDKMLLESLQFCKTTRQLDKYVSLPLLHRMMVQEGRNPSLVSDLHDFYNLFSSKNWVVYVDVPMISINAKDDPVSRYECIPLWTAKVNKNLAFILTQKGGHVGWLDTWRPFTRSGYKENYAERIVMEFIDKL